MIFLLKINIMIVFLYTSCWNKSLDYDIKNGINYVFDEDTKTFRRIFFAKNHKYYGFIYEFYNNGIIHSITNTDDINQKTLIYNEFGELVNTMLEFENRDNNGKLSEFVYKYATIDSSITAFVSPSSFILTTKLDTIKIDKPMVKNKTIHPADFLIYNKSDSIEIHGIINYENKIQKLVSIPLRDSLFWQNKKYRMPTLK